MLCTSVLKLPPRRLVKVCKCPPKTSPVFSLSGQFAAEFVEKTLVKGLMVQLLQAEKEGSAESAGRLLTDQVLEVDRQLLQVARSTLPVEISGVWMVGGRGGGGSGEGEIIQVCGWLGRGPGQSLGNADHAGDQALRHPGGPEGQQPTSETLNWTSERDER